MSGDAEWIGRRIEELPTPCLLVEAEALDHNLRFMAEFFRARACKLRPHFKSHKCVTLAKRQLAAGGACGVTCAKLAEAAALVAGGVQDVLIANQVVGRDKARRLAVLNRKASVRVAVDSQENLHELAAAAREAQVVIGCLVEVDVGMGRCGVAAGEPALDLARCVSEARGLRFDGLQGYEGHAVGIADPAQRERVAREAMGLLVETRRLIESAGFSVAIVSAGGTGTHDVTGNIEGVDEVQAGSYALMDCHYVKVRPEFRNALTVLTTVISAAKPGRVVLDVGVKGVGAEFGPPVVLGRPGAQIPYFRAEEHAVVQGLEARVGDKVQLIPSHGCTTCNLHRRVFLHHGAIVEHIWPIEAAGALE